MIRTGQLRFASLAKLRISTALVSGLAILAPTGTTSAADADIAGEVVEESVGESSVLVARRKATGPVESNAAEGDLQPISATSDKEPILADPEPTLAPIPPGEVERQPVKMAANTTEIRSNNNAPAATEPSTSIEPALFHGIQPGVSQKKDLLEAWGAPREVSPAEEGQQLIYDLESFRGVEVLVEAGVVTLMKIQLMQAEEPQVLARKVRADKADAVKISNPETGRLMAVAYPERGIVLLVDEVKEGTAEAKPMVSEMWLQPLDGETFALRADSRPRYEYAARLADLERAISLAPNDSHSHWLRAEALLDVGRAAEAELAAKQALDLEPENIEYRQRWGETLAAVGKYDDAVLATRKVLDEPKAPTLARARALHQMGKLASLGDAKIAGKAVNFHNLAIEEADKLAASEQRQVRLQAKRLLVDAHLAIAHEISRRDYADKLENVAQWVTRASGIAEQAIAKDKGELDLRVRVAEGSLAALANFKPANDPAPLIEEIETTIEQIESESIDSLRMEQLQWAAGLAYLRAVQIEHHRREPESALKYSEKAIELLADKAEDRRDDPLTEQLVGRLYFHIGAVHAVHNKQHDEAVTWYDRALPLMISETPDSEFAIPRREGEALVSMAVSYWDQNDKQRAVSLTETGAELIERAVEGGVIEAKTLAVPYGNLAVMHEKLGNTEESERYNQLVETLKKLTDGEVPAQADTKPSKPQPQKTVAAKPKSSHPSVSGTSNKKAPQVASQPRKVNRNVSGRQLRGSRWTR